MKAAKTEKQKLDERRKEVLSRGKKFKYPIQYAKHKVVVITVVVAVLAVAAILTAGWVMLYKAQDTGDVAYRITKVLPIPVAKIDGRKVRYSDYLMIYRSSITPVERQGTGSIEDLQGMQNYYKREALDLAEDFVVVLKLAEEMGISVSDEEIDAAFSEHQKAGGADRSRESFLKVLSDNFGMNEREYRRMLYFNLMQKKVAVEMDKDALKLAKEVEGVIKSEGMEAAAEKYGDKVVFEDTGGLVSAMNVDGGRAAEAAKLEENGVSGMFVSTNGEGYYFVKLTEKKGNEVGYQSIMVPFTKLEEKLEEARKAGVEEYIYVPEVEEEEQ